MLAISQSRTSHILSKTLVVIFAPFPSFTIDAELNPLGFEFLLVHTFVYQQLPEFVVTVVQMYWDIIFTELFVFFFHYFHNIADITLPTMPFVFPFAM